MSVRDADSHKLMYHPEQVSKWLNEENVFPLHVEIGITNRCNHQCCFCTVDWVTHGKFELSKDVMFNLIDDMCNCGVKSIYLAGEGEPTLYKNLDQIVKRAYNAGISVALSTNGSLMNRELAEKIFPYLSWIRFSVDAYKPATHAKIHGVSEKELDKIFRNISDCVVVKKDKGYGVQIGTQAIFMPENANEMIPLAKAMKTFGVDNFQVKPVHSHPKSSYNSGIYQLTQSELEKTLNELQSDNFIVVVRTKSMERLTEPRNYERCHAFDFYGLIDARGNVVPCNIFYNEPEYIYGNINEKSFIEIWTSERRKEIISKLEKSNHCKCGEYRCRLDVMNRYLERVKNPEVNDEFI